MKWIGVALIAAAAVAMIAYKTIGASDQAAPTASAGAPRVLLFANLAEADDACPCGDIIRAVRGVAAKGIPTRENDDALGREHKVTVEPTVIILDPSGREQARFEGESRATRDKLVAELAKLAESKP